MEVYEFEKCLLTRLKECRNVLCWKDEAVPASSVRDEWSYFIELQIEPTGWQALWKVPRVICEELHIKYPTIVHGEVSQVLFKELKAIFSVTAVEDEDIQIPERQEVCLEDLWPTKSQENTELNIEKTADCIDQLRFFYNNVWMPWDNDNDDDLDWAEKHLESRIRFYYDLKKKDMKRSLAAHIKTLLTEARYIQKRREYLEIGLSDDEELDETLDKTQITDLMRMHLRLTIIKSELEILENPEMRRIYEEVKFDDENFLKGGLNGNKEAVSVYIVMKASYMEQQIKMLEMAREKIVADKKVLICPSLQDALNVCNASDEIYLSPGHHSIKFLEYLNSDGKISGLRLNCESFVESVDAIKSTDITIFSQEDDSILLILDGNFTLENLILDCRNTRSGILVKNGTIRLRNCSILGEGSTSTTQGIVASGCSCIILENCIIEHFAFGIVLNDKSQANLNKTTLRDCGIGLEMNEGAHVIFDNCNISKSRIYGLWLETSRLNNKIELKNLNYNKLEEVAKDFCDELPWKGDCCFEGITNNNIFVINKKKTKFYPLLNCDSDEDTDDKFLKNMEAETRMNSTGNNITMMDESISE